MIKKTTIFLLTICILSILTGCGKKDTEHGVSAKNPQEIEIWHYLNGAQAIAFEVSVNEFNETVGLEKGIMVIAKSKSSVDDLAQALDASVNKRVGAEKLPNIAQCYVDTAVQLDQKDILINLQDMLIFRTKYLTKIRNHIQ